MKILLGEANLRNQVAMADSLRRIGHCVHIVGDGVELVRRLRGARFDVVFVDFDLPLLDMGSAVRMLLNYTGSQPRVVVTSTEAEEHIRHKLPTGVDAVLRKPASAVELAAVLQSSQAATEEEQPAVDEREILGLVPGEKSTRDFLDDLTETLAEHGMELLNGLFLSYEAREWSGCASAARELRGTAASFGARTLGSVCQTLEESESVNGELVSAVVYQFLRAVHELWNLTPAGDPLQDCVIYLVDDESRSLQLLKKLLRSRGFRRILGTPTPALLEAIISTHLPDLAVLDFHIGKVSGLDLLDRLASLRAARPPVPVLMLTGETHYEVRRTALQKGARDFVNKPFDPPEMMARVKNLLEVRVAQVQVHRQNVLLEEQVQLRTAQLKASQNDILARLGVAAEARIDPSGQHVRRVGRLAELLGRIMGLDEETRQLLGPAAQLHDVGKVTIPEEILLKKGVLNPHEWGVIRTHSQAGAALLGNADCEVMRMAEEIARTHHERWDGTGYPAALTAEEIPLMGRIVALCDAFDAMTMERPHQSARSPQAAMAEIRANSGTQFDPLLVELFSKATPSVFRLYAEEFSRDAAPRES